MDTDEPGTPDAPEARTATRAHHRSALWFVVVFSVGLVLLVALNMK
jgi:hypothetical protein